MWCGGLGLEALYRRCDVSPRLKFEMTKSRLGLETERLGLGLDFGLEALASFSAEKASCINEIISKAGGITTTLASRKY